ncbi:hypothetical protein P2318_05070 [Myxococcaceae bacterium GXIMD 01537]
MEPGSAAPLRSIYMERSAFSLASDPLAGGTEIALTRRLYSSVEEAHAAVRDSRLEGDGTAVYAHYRGAEGIIFPTILSATTAPNLIRALGTLLSRERGNAKAAAGVLTDSILLAAGLRYPSLARMGPKTGRLRIAQGRRLSPR